MALFWWNNSRNYLWYLVELTPQSNNDTIGSRLINNMTFPHIWLAQNITNIKRGNITHCLILEGLDAIGQMTLLADTKISSLVKPLDVVWLRVLCCWQPQLFDDLSWEVTPKWLLDEDVSVVIGRRWRMCAKFSIISSLCHARACSSNNLI